MLADDQFVAAAIRRTYTWMLVLAPAGAAALLLWKGWRHAGGFLVGAALSILNFHWLKRGTDAMAAHAQPAPGNAPARRPAVVARFLLRYALILFFGYVIFRSSALNINAFLGGLFVFVAGVMLEIGYELATAPGPKD